MVLSVGFDVSALVFATAVLIALGIDRFWGEPPVRWHPVVWMGRYLGWAGRRLAAGAAATGPDFKRFWLGALAWSAGAAIIFIAAWALQQGLLALPERLGPVPGGLLAALGLGLALKPMLAWAMLGSEVLAVEQALSPEHGGSLAAGRERLSWLVSRDVSELSESQVRESAIESLAENLNDSVVAPIFWFVLLGLPGAALYRFANTADAMWGYRGVYKGQNWEWAGKWAARADDGLGWLPARITALLLWGVGGGRGRGLRGGWAALRVEAARTPSPNSGWPMAAMALALDVCLHKPRVYALNASGRAPLAPDTTRALFYASEVLLALVLIAPAAIIFIAFWRLL
jgi:adenosylcobinamide-phosphate synthase